LRLAFFILISVLATFSVRAQYSFSGSTSGNINIASIQSLTLSGGTTVPTLSTTDDFASGITMGSYLNVVVKSNVAWTLSVQAQNAYFSAMSQGGSTNMPASVLSIKPSSSSNYFNLSTSSQTLKSGGKGSSTAPGNAFSIDVKFSPGFSYKGGIYTIGLMYTLSQQ
jgi:hypothetical protein